MAQQLKGQPGPEGVDVALAGAVMGVVALVGIMWAGLQLAGLFAGHLGLPVGLGRLGQGLLRWPAHAADPRAAFPGPLRADLPAGPVVYLAEALVLAVVATAAALVARRWWRPGHDRELAGVTAEVATRGLARPVDLRRAYPSTDHALVLGKAGGAPVAIPAETSVGLVMGSRMGKFSAAVGWVLDHKGPVLCTSTKVDLVELTAVLRQQSTNQATLVLDPEGLCAWPHKVRWSPVRGCGDPGVAQERAAALMAGVRTGGVTNSGFFKGKGSALLRLVLHAAALDGAGVEELRRWVAAPATARPVPKALHQTGAAPGWAEEWDGLTRGDQETVANIAATASLSLDWLARPDVARLCSPTDGDAFDPAKWLETGGTLHVVASGTAAASTAPLAAALVDAVMRAVRRVAPGGPAGRLDPPLRCVLDELPSVAPLPGLPAYLADAGGQGVQLVCISQAMSQYAISYGREGLRAIETAFGALALGGGIKDTEELERFSRLAGEVEVRRTDHSRGPDARPADASHRERRRVIEPAELGRLPKHRALLLSQAAKPALVDLVPWWERPDAGAIREAWTEARSHRGAA
jgi:type IV secretion system protein VirD4